ncbi:hypothetical protein LINPERHAP1_LOCUS8450 [Linum perenne]
MNGYSPTRGEQLRELQLETATGTRRWWRPRREIIRPLILLHSVFEWAMAWTQDLRIGFPLTRTDQLIKLEGKLRLAASSGTTLVNASLPTQ